MILINKNNGLVVDENIHKVLEIQNIKIVDHLKVNFKNLEVKVEKIQDRNEHGMELEGIKLEETLEVGNFIY